MGLPPPRDQSLLESTPHTSHSSSTHMVSTTHLCAHQPGSTMVSPLSVMALRTTRTTGAAAGASTATSRCPETGTTTVELPPWLSTLSPNSYFFWFNQNTLSIIIFAIYLELL